MSIKHLPFRKSPFIQLHYNGAMKLIRPIKKHYFAYALVSIIMLLITLSAYFWIAATTQSKILLQGLNKAYALQIDDQDLQIQLTHAITQINSDELNLYIRQFSENTEMFEKFMVTQRDDDYAQALTKTIVDARRKKTKDLENFKTYRAILNSSMIKADAKESSGELSPADALTLHRIISGYYAVTLEESLPIIPHAENPQIQPLLKKLYLYAVKTNRMTKKLAHSSTDGLQDKLISRLEALLKEKEQFRTFIMWNFVFWTFVGLALSLVLYLRDHKSFRHAQRLSNDLKQFVDALNASSIVSKTDTRGVITFVNDTFCEVSGYSREELIGQPHSIVRHPDSPSTVFEELWNTIQNGSIFKAILKNRRKDGSAYYVNSTIFPLKNQEGEIIEYLAVRHEVTELILSRDKAIEAERFKDNFLSNMSHELRTPLNGIIGFSQLLEHRIKDETHLKYIKSILDSSHHLLEIINDILDISKIKSGKFTLEYRPFDLYRSFASLFQRLEIQAIVKNIHFSYDLEISDTLQVEGDWLRISQIMTNIISNAIKFTPEGGKVAIKALYRDEILECKIADSGIGMDEATIERIFQPFEQADSSITRKFGGTGLGLSITKELVERMDGNIEVYSRIGAGSRFIVTIKLKEVCAI